jgi:Membrane protein involved in the export of O-antigen and teichoic acid
LTYKNFIFFLSKLKTNRLITDSIWSLIGNVLGKGLTLLAGIIIARLLQKETFGEYGIIRNTILTISVFSTFGLGYTATKFVSEYKNSDPEKLNLFIKYSTSVTLFFSSLMAIGLFIFAETISINFLDSDTLILPLRILSVLIIFNAVSTTQIGILAGFGKFKELTRINSIIGVITFLLSIIFTYYWNLNGAIFSLLVVQILNCIMNFLEVRKCITIKKEFNNTDKSLLKKIITFSTPIALQELTYSAGSWISNILLVKFSNYGELGIYSAAMQWYAILLFIPGILRNVVLSHLSEQVNDINAHRKILKQTVIVNIICTLIPCFIVFIFSGIISNSYGRSFDGVGLIISIAAFTAIFSSVNNVFAQAYTSKGKNWTMLFFRFFSDMSTLATFVILVNYTKLKGALSLVVSNLTLAIILTIVIVLYYIKAEKKYTIS